MSRLLVVGSLLAGSFGLALADSVVTFDNGAEGWIGPSGAGGGTVIESTGGNPGAHMHTIFNDFGVTFHNSSNPEFIGDYTAEGSVTLAIDVKVELIEFFGAPVSRPWLVDLRDYDDPWPGYPYKSVWYKFDQISEASNSSWGTYSVTIEDTSSTELPPGWGGSGYEDPKTFEPLLPPGTTFTDVLAGVDEIAFTTLEPGFFFGFTDFDIRLDNISIFQGGAPVPGTVAGLTLGKSSPVPDTLVLSWDASCGSTALDYAIYRGNLGTWTSHGRIDCSDNGADRTETVPVTLGDSYYLVVPLDVSTEGSYGTDSEGAERPQGFPVCRPVQNTDPCE